jgi:uncharacterized protein
MPFAIAGALVVGLSLGIFGSGGSILTIPVLVYLLGHDSKIAIAESLAIVGAIALIGSARFARSKLVEWRMAFLFGLPGMAGTYLGAFLASLVSGSLQLLVFGSIMLLASYMMWKRSKGGLADTEGSSIPSRHFLKPMRDGAAVGVVTGFVGVGGGFLIVPALVILGGLTMRRAVGTSLVIISMNAAIGFVKYLQVLSDLGGRVDWTTIGIFAVVGIIGSLIGKSLNTRINQAALQRGFAVFLVVMALFVIIREAPSAFGNPPTPAAQLQEGGSP